MITAKHQSGTRKNFTGKNDLFDFMKKEPNPELWSVNIDSFKCTGAEVVEYAGNKTQTTDSKNTILAKLLKHRKSLLELLTNK